MSHSIDISESEAERLDQQIKDLQSKRDTVRSRAKEQQATILVELSNSRFEAHGMGIRVRPSPAMTDVLPKDVGSQDRWCFPLGGGVSLDISDYGAMLWSTERESIAGRLRWLAGHGVRRDSVSLANDGYGTVRYAELQLSQAIKERDKTLAQIEEAFQ